MSVQRQIIESIETFIVDLQLVRDQQFAALRAKAQCFVLIFIRTKDGIEGVGESSVPSGPWWGGESAESIKVNIDTYLAPLVIGQDAFNVDATTRANAEDLTSNWELLDWYDTIFSGAVAKVLKRSQDLKAGTAFAEYAAMRETMWRSLATVNITAQSGGDNQVG